RSRMGSTCPRIGRRNSSRRTLTDRWHDAGEKSVVAKGRNGEIMMRAMRAESFTGYGGRKLVEVPRPRRDDGRVLVRITAAGVTPLDHTILSGGYPRATPPLILGHEGAGGVEDPGDSVFSEGARVMFAGP